MFLNIKIMLLVFFQLSTMRCTFQEPINPYNIISKKGCLILTKGGTNLDTLYSNSFNGDGIKKNQILEYKNNIIIQIELKSRGIDDFSYVVKRWTIINDLFSLESSLEIPIRNCNVTKKLRIGLTKEGIKWKIKKRLIKQNIKGIIPYSKMKELKKYHLPNFCSFVMSPYSIRRSQYHLHIVYI